MIFEYIKITMPFGGDLTNVKALQTMFEPYINIINSDIFK